VPESDELARGLEALEAGVWADDAAALHAALSTLNLTGATRSAARKPILHNCSGRPSMADNLEFDRPVSEGHHATGGDDLAKDTTRTTLTLPPKAATQETIEPRTNPSRVVSSLSCRNWASSETRIWRAPGESSDPIMRMLVRLGLVSERTWRRRSRKSWTSP